MPSLGIVNRTIAGYLAILAGVIMLAGYSLFGLTNIIDNETIVDKSKDRAVYQLQAAYNFANAAGQYRAYILYKDTSQIEAYKQSMTTAKELLNKNLEISRPENRPKIEAILKMLDDYNAGINLVLNGKLDPLEANSIVVPLAKNIHKDLQALSQDNISALQQASEQSVSQAVTVRSMSITVSVVVLIVSIVGVIMALRLRKPFQEVVGAAHVYATGDFTKPVGYSAKDELGDIADTLNTMAKNMREVIRNVMNSAEQVAASSEELTASAEQTARAAGQVADSITTVAQGADEQLKGVDSAVAVVEEMSAGAQQAAANAQAVASMSDKTSQAAQEGGKAVEQAIDKMADIEKTVNHSAKVVSQLGERSKEIGQIVTTIAGIAGQTNLLALNAAIEAARAGEQGRGFAVVAEEVRKLAEQSQEAAKQIAELITAIQTDTDKAVVAMDAGTHEVREGAEVVNTASTAFREIIGLVEQVSGQIREVSATVEQMAAGSQHIVASMREIDRVSRDIAAETQSVSAATEEQSASMQEIASSSEALATLAQDFQTVVKQFKI